MEKLTTPSHGDHPERPKQRSTIKRALDAYRINGDREKLHAVFAEIASAGQNPDIRRLCGDEAADFEEMMEQGERKRRTVMQNGDQRSDQM